MYIFSCLHIFEKFSPPYLISSVVAPCIDWSVNIWTRYLPTICSLEDLACLSPHQARYQEITREQMSPGLTSASQSTNLGAERVEAVYLSLSVFDDTAPDTKHRGRLTIITKYKTQRRLPATRHQQPHATNMGLGHPVRTSVFPGASVNCLCQFYTGR